MGSDGSRVIMLCHTIPVLDCLNPELCSKQTGTTLVLASRSTNASCWSDADCDPLEILDLIPLVHTIEPLATLDIGGRQV